LFLFLIQFYLPPIFNNSEPTTPAGMVSGYQKRNNLFRAERPYILRQTAEKSRPFGPQLPQENFKGTAGCKFGDAVGMGLPGMVPLQFAPPHLHLNYKFLPQKFIPYPAF
jgi:hypothetical protein